MSPSPTRIEQNTPTLIDICFSNLKHVSMAGVLSLTISDHLPTFIRKKKGKRKKTVREFRGRDYSLLNSDKIKATLDNKVPKAIATGTDPNTIWNGIEANFLSKLRTPYLIGQIGDAMVQHDRFFHRARLKPRDKHLWAEAKSHKYAVRALIRRSKRGHIQQMLEKNSN